MDELSASFVNEAHELLENLEEALLKLENHPADNEQINTVFRVMHSLKGTGAMFGFDELSTFTHEMESLYDMVRSGKYKIDKGLIDFTFRSIDIIRLLLEKPEDAETQQRKKAFLEELSQRFSEPDPTPEQPPAKASTVSSQKSKNKPLATWHIRFIPHSHILQNGTRPLYLLDELSETGKLKSFLHTEKIPRFPHLPAENVYVWWDLLLVTDKSENFIKDVFIFVEDESQIEIKKIADGDLLGHPGAEKIMTELDFHESITDEKLTQWVEQLPLNQQEKEQDFSEYEPERPEKTTDTGTEEKYHKTTEEPPELSRQTIDPSPENADKESPVLHETVRVSSAKLDELLDIISEVVTTQARLLHYSQNHEDPELENITEAYEKLARQLRENALDMRLIPIYTILIRFKRLVRDLSSRLNKDIVLKTTGTETELDKSMIEKLYDPLMHILRNSIDHGIEPPDERIKAGKDPKGLIHIATSYSGAHVIIKISDDGRGMDEKQLRETALHKGLLSPDTEYSKKEILQLIFLPGFTTSEKVSRVSGRGVGMDVVKKNIEELRGSIEVDTEKGKGTTITLSLPLTLSIIDGLLVYVGENRYIIPVSHIKHIYPVTRKELENTINQVINKENKQIPFVDLVKEFGEKDINEKEMYLVVVNYGNRETALVINKIAGKYQAVIKPLSRIAQKQEIFSGASILGDGNIALVMDINKLIYKFLNHE
jgi:two-component system chemotaxis sensor kinase CheA